MTSQQVASKGWLLADGLLTRIQRGKVVVSTSL